MCTTPVDGSFHSLALAASLVSSWGHEEEREREGRGHEEEREGRGGGTRKRERGGEGA
jgi:hypothetical protein